MDARSILATATVALVATAAHAEMDFHVDLVDPAIYGTGAAGQYFMA